MEFIIYIYFSNKKLKLKSTGNQLGIITHAFNPSSRETERQADVSEFETANKTYQWETLMDPQEKRTIFIKSYKCQKLNE